MKELIVTGDVINAYRILFGTREEGACFRKPDQSAVKMAYRQKAKLFHPDLAANSSMSEERLKNIFLKIANAYEILLKWVHEESEGGVYSPSVSVVEKATRWEPIKPNVPVPTSQYFTADYFYMQGIPNRKLRFGEYLFYSGHINWQTLMDALVYQCEVRPMMGSIAIELGFLDEESVTYIMNHRNILSCERFGEAAFRLGYLTKKEISLILKKQYQMGQPFGKYFLDKGLMDKRQLQQLLADFHCHNSSFGLSVA